MQFMWSYHFGLVDYVLYYNGSHEFESDYDFEQKINNDIVEINKNEYIKLKYMYESQNETNLTMTISR